MVLTNQIFLLSVPLEKITVCLQILLHIVINQRKETFESSIFNWVWLGILSLNQNFGNSEGAYRSLQTEDKLEWKIGFFSPNEQLFCLSQLIWYCFSSVDQLLSKSSRVSNNFVFLLCFDVLAVKSGEITKSWEINALSLGYEPCQVGVYVSL